MERTRLRKRRNPKDGLGDHVRMAEIANLYPLWLSQEFILQNLENFDLEKYQSFQDNVIEMINSLDNCKVFNIERHNFRDKIAYGNKIVYGNLPIVFHKPTSHLRLRDLGIEANKYYKPLTNQENSQWLYDRIVNLPLSDSFGDFELEKIKYILKKISWDF